MSKLNKGINKDISNEEYHGDRTHVSSSGLKMILTDPLQFYKKYVKNEEGASNSSPAMDLGSFVHSIILEPDKTDSEFVVYNGVRRGSRWEEFQEKEAKDKIVISALHARTAEDMVETYENNRHAIDLIKNSTPEQTVCTDLEKVPVKVRADAWRPDINAIVDIKTTSSNLSYPELQEAIGNFYYDLSAALYVDVFKKELKLEKTPDFYFVFIGSRDTKDTVVYKASKSLLENGRRKYKKALKRYTQCKEKGKWIEDGILEIDVPSWAAVAKDS